MGDDQADRWTRQTKADDAAVVAEARRLLNGKAAVRECRPGCDGYCRACIDTMGASGALSLAAPRLARHVIDLAARLAASQAQTAALAAAVRVYLDADAARAALDAALAAATTPKESP